MIPLFTLTICAAVSLLPSARPAAVAVSEADVTYYLYTRNTGTSTLARVNLGAAAASALDLNKPIKFLCHGYQSSVDSEWYAPAIEEFLGGSDVNVIAIDWSGPADLLYWESVDAVQQVAKVNAKLIQELHENLGVDLGNVHLIGHSLGAHIMGFTGQEVLALTGGLVGRITGLDPAGPWWNGKSEDERLSAEDAVFVEAIHTDGNLLGFGERVADVDYFPNGGVATQPGCSEIGCSHNRAPLYFIESINNRNFIGRKCSSKLLYSWGLCNSNEVAIVGEDYSGLLDGAFYFKTGEASPFGLGEDGL